MRRIVVAGLAALCTTLVADHALSQTTFGPEPTISWEVKSRFRLFRYEADFLKQVDADRGDGLVAAEQRLAQATDGHGWARTMLNSLCLDQGGRGVEGWDRDGGKENYLGRS